MVRSIGKSYAIDDYSKYYEKFKSSFPAKSAFDVSTEGKTFYFATETGSTTLGKLFAEVTGNLVLEDGMLRTGNESSTIYNFNLSDPSQIKAEANTVSNIHTHQLSEQGTLGYKYGNMSFGIGSPRTPGRPSYPEDYRGAGANGWRHVVVDSKYINIHNGDPSQDIRINRKNKWGGPAK